MSLAGIALVGLGGAAGSIARYLLGGWVTAAAAPQAFPLGTFFVNLAGCLAVGLLAGLVERHPGWLAPDLRLLLFVGVLGGFTTFSTFALETMTLVRDGSWAIALAGFFANNAGGLALALAGIYMGRIVA